jgi:hypothetical protein
VNKIKDKRVSPYDLLVIFDELFLSTQIPIVEIVNIIKEKIDL